MPIFSVGGAIALSGAASAGASIFSGLMGAKGANKSADATRYAADVGARTALDLYGQTKTTLNPFVQTGTAATNQLTSLYNGTANVTDQLNADPLFNWQSEELQRFTERQLARQGLTNSGAGLELNRRGYQQLLGDNSQRYINNLFEGAKIGANAGAMTGQAAGQAAGQVGQFLGQGAQQAGNAYIQQGVAYGNAATGATNAINSGVGTYLNNQNYQNLIARFPQQDSTARSYRAPALEDFAGFK